MTWFIGPIDLPIDPASVHRRVARKQTVDKIQQQLPFAVDTGPDLYELNITGLIYPEWKAWALWELVKKAEQVSIEIRITDERFAMFQGRYAVNRAETGMDGPKYIADVDATLDGVAAVHEYNINFIQFADQGSLADGDSADTLLDEDGVAFGDININMGDFSFGDFTFPFTFDNLWGN